MDRSQSTAYSREAWEAVNQDSDAQSDRHPVLATLYAALIFSEMPPALFYFGSCLILIGILVVTWKIPFVSGDSREIA
jgi:hypothetical protein